MIDAWSGPTPTPQQFPHNEPNGIRKLLDKIKAVELQVKESTSNLLRTAGIYLSPTGMTIDSNLAITGTLSLPAGIINNDALTSPTKPAKFSALVTNFGLTAGLNVLTSTTLTVPTGFTGAVILGTSRVFIMNEGITGVYMQSRLYLPLSGAPTVTATLVLDSGGSGTNHAPNSAILTGLTAGGSVVIQLQAGTTGGTTAADTQNIASIDGVVIWTR